MKPISPAPPSWGSPRGALIKQPLGRFVHKKDHDIYYLHRKQLFDTHSAALQGLVQTGPEQAGACQEYEVRMVKNDGKLFWAHLTATAAGDVDGPLVSSIIITDITERKIQEEKLQKLNRTLTALTHGRKVMMQRRR